jgi:excisionase family DNA binding protein
LHIDEKTVRRRIKDGALRSIKIGRLRRIDPRDLDDTAACKPYPSR